MKKTKSIVDQLPEETKILISMRNDGFCGANRVYDLSSYSRLSDESFNY